MSKQWPHPDFVRARIREDAAKRLSAETGACLVEAWHQEEMEVAGAVRRLSDARTAMLPTLKTRLYAPADCEFSQIPSVGDGYVVSAVHMCFGDGDTTLTLVPSEQADMISGEEHLREVSQLQARAEKAEKALIMSAIGAEQSYFAKASEVIKRQEVENAALRSQLSLAEERRRPARHRPGEQVSVGWDPE